MLPKSYIAFWGIYEYTIYKRRFCNTVALRSQAHCTEKDAKNPLVGVADLGEFEHSVVK